MDNGKSTGENTMNREEPTRELPPINAPGDMTPSSEQYFTPQETADASSVTYYTEKKSIWTKVLMIGSIVTLLVALVLAISLFLQTNQTQNYRAQAQTYNTQLKKVMQINSDLNNANSGLSQQNNQLTTDVSSTVQQNSKLNNDVSSANQQNSKLSHDVSSATAKANQAQADLDAKIAQVNQINSQLAGLNTQLSTLNSQLTAKQADLAKAQRGVAKFADLKSYLLAYDQETGQAINLINAGYQALLNGQNAQTYNDQINALVPKMQQNADNINAIFNAIQSGNY